MWGVPTMAIAAAADERMKRRRLIGVLAFKESDKGILGFVVWCSDKGCTLSNALSEKRQFGEELSYIIRFL
jgi:hypothetical protein